MSKSELAEISTPEELRRARERLDSKACDALVIGYLHVAIFSDELHTQVDTIDATRRGVRSSVGIDWIKDNFHLFTGVYDKLNRWPFFADHLDNPYVTEVLYDNQFVGLFKEQELRQVAASIADRHVMPSVDWLLNLARQGVSSELLAAFVYNRLHSVGFTAEQTAPFVEAYVKYGAGRVMQDSVTPLDNCGNPRLVVCGLSAWGVVGDELQELLLRCAQERPDLFFAGNQGDELSLFDKLWAYQDRIRPRGVMNMAMQHLTSLKAVDLAVMDKLDFEQVHRLVRRLLPHSLELLVNTLLSGMYLSSADDTVEVIDFIEVWEQTAPTDRQEFCTVFRKVYLRLREVIELAKADRSPYSRGVTSAEVILEALVAKMNSHGFVIATAESQKAKGPRKGIQIVANTPKGNGVLRYVHSLKVDQLIVPGDVVVIDAAHPQNELVLWDKKRKLTIVSTVMLPASCR